MASPKTQRLTEPPVEEIEQDDHHTADDHKEDHCEGAES